MKLHKFKQVVFSCTSVYEAYEPRDHTCNKIICLQQRYYCTHTTWQSGLL